jgi:hypothetical protein
MATNDNPYLDPTSGAMNLQAPPTTTDPGVLPTATGQPRSLADPEGTLYDVPATALGALESARQPGATTGQYVTPESTVSGQLMSLLDRDSPYLRQADTRAREEANKMGLLSSSMTVGATERERIAAALPIAQQDAQLFGTSALKEQDYASSSALDTQKTAGQSALATQAHTQNIEALGVQGDIGLTLETFSQAAATERQTTQLEFDAAIANAEMDSTIRQQYLSSSADLNNQFSADVSAILRSPDFKTPEDRGNAIDNIFKVYKANMSFMAEAASVPLDWTAFDISTAKLTATERERIEQIKAEESDAAAAAELAAIEQAKDEAKDIKERATILNPGGAVAELLPGYSKLEEAIGYKDPVSQLADKVSSWF